MIGQHADILVIDDELTVCRSCQKILNEDGYTVSIALSGYEGLERSRKKDFDLAIVDLKMPDIDGMEVVEAIKREQPGTEVIIITGYSTIASAVQGIKLGATDYLPKPFTPDEMIMAVKKALRQQEYEAKRKDTGPVINKEAIIAVLNRAAEERKFIAKLSDLGSDALWEYNLTPEEEAALVSGDVRWLEDHVGKLDDKLKVWLECRLQQERW
jgi:DNA-binding NtrC family response regulator